MKPLKHSVGLLLIGVLLNFAAAAEPMKGEPFISVEQAIVLAKNYVKERKIDVSRSYIGSAVLNLNPRGDRGPFWLVVWEPKENLSSAIKAVGGQVSLSVYMNRQIEVRFGE